MPGAPHALSSRPPAVMVVKSASTPVAQARIELAANDTTEALARRLHRVPAGRWRALLARASLDAVALSPCSHADTRNAVRRRPFTAIHLRTLLVRAPRDAADKLSEGNGAAIAPGVDGRSVSIPVHGEASFPTYSRIDASHAPGLTTAQLMAPTAQTRPLSHPVAVPAGRDAMPRSTLTCRVPSPSSTTLPLRMAQNHSQQGCDPS